MGNFCHYLFFMFLIVLTVVLCRKTVAGANLSEANARCSFITRDTESLADVQEKSCLSKSTFVCEVVSKKPKDQNLPGSTMSYTTMITSAPLTEEKTPLPAAEKSTDQDLPGSTMPNTTMATSVPIKDEMTFISAGILAVACVLPVLFIFMIVLGVCIYKRKRSKTVSTVTERQRMSYSYADVCQDEDNNLQTPIQTHSRYGTANQNCNEFKYSQPGPNAANTTYEVENRRFAEGNYDELHNNQPKGGAAAEDGLYDSARPDEEDYNEIQLGTKQKRNNDPDQVYDISKVPSSEGNYDVFQNTTKQGAGVNESEYDHVTHDKSRKPTNDP